MSQSRRGDMMVEQVRRSCWHGLLAGTVHTQSGREFGLRTGHNPDEWARIAIGLRQALRLGSEVAVMRVIIVADASGYVAASCRLSLRESTNLNDDSTGCD
jgi:hypothetical protein